MWTAGHRIISLKSIKTNDLDHFGGASIDLSFTALRDETPEITSRAIPDLSESSFRQFLTAPTILRAKSSMRGDIPASHRTHPVFSRSAYLAIGAC